MFCPDCGYSLTAFDKDCPRCARLRTQRKGCPHCGTAAPVDARKCGKCGHAFSASITQQAAARRDDAWEPSEPSPMPLTPPAAPMPSTMAPPPLLPPITPLNSEMLACRVCGNTAGQKVSAVCQQGTWSGVSQGQSIGAIYTSDGVIPVTSVSASSSRGGTQIAQALLPPQRPFFRHSWTGSILVPLLGYVTALFICIFSPLAATIAIAVTSLLWFIVLMAEARAEADGQARLQSEDARWQAAMVIWDRLFYCARCDHVYDPQGAAATRPGGMSRLLFGSLPVAVTPLQSREFPLRLTVEKAAMIACGTALVLLALVWGMNYVFEQGQAAGMPPAAIDLPTSTVSTSPVSTPSVAVPDPAPSLPQEPGGYAPPASDAPPSPAPPAFQMKTAAGGGPPPDLSQFKSQFKHH